MPAVALTDHGNLFGAYQFHTPARKQGCARSSAARCTSRPADHRRKTPLPGRRKPYDHLVLLAENERGWRNLTRLVSCGYLEGFYHRPRISKELLAEHREGLIGLSACLSGEVAAPARWATTPAAARGPPPSTGRSSATGRLLPRDPGPRLGGRGVRP